MDGKQKLTRELGTRYEISGINWENNNGKKRQWIGRRKTTTRGTEENLLLRGGDCEEAE